MIPYGIARSLYNLTAVCIRHCLRGLIALPILAWAGPEQGQVAAGNATISSSGNRTEIFQSSDRAVINWGSFSIGADEIAQFIQPSAKSVTLNRVTGGDASLIAGQLKANGHVMLVNPNGIAFTATARIDVGSLTATTANIADADFMAGRYIFSDAPTNSAVSNAGLISVRGAGLAALVAPHVRNSGVIEAYLGTVEVTSARGFTLDLYGDRLFSFKLEDRVAETLRAADGTPLTALVQNDGTIDAAGGRVYLTAQAASDVVNQSINTSGIIRAQAVAQDGGAIVLSGSGAVAVSGILDASASTSAMGGEIRVLGDRVALDSGALIDVSGQQAGGTALVGGDFQGSNPDVSNARFTTVADGASIRANGSDQGGRVIVWADGTTQFGGAISARGQGFAEVSGKGTLRFSGTVDTGGGTLLLDPTDITVQSADGNQIDAYSGGQIATLLASNNLVLAADNNITWNADATLDFTGIGSTGRTLTLQAGNNIVFNGAIGDSVAGGDLLHVVLNADRDANGVGGITVGSGASITTSGGDITLRGGNAALAALPSATLTTWETALPPTAARGVAISGATLDAGGGDITVRSVGVDGMSSGRGVVISNSTVRSDGTGIIAIDGIGGNGSDNNRGVYVTTSTVSTADGTLRIQGMGRGTGIENSGVRTETSTIEATGSGNLTIVGTGSTGGNTNDGVVIDGGAVRSHHGAIFMSGTARGSGNGSDGVELANNAVVEVTGSASLNLVGNSAATGASDNRGIVVWLGASARSASGTLSFQGTTANDNASNSGITLQAATIGGAGQNGMISFVTDSADFVSGTIRGSTLAIRPDSATTTMGVGDGATGALHLSSTELGLIQDGFSSITFGRLLLSGTFSMDVGNASFSDPVNFQSNTVGSTTFRGTLTGSEGITVNSGPLTLSGATFNVTGALSITGSSYTVTGASTLKSDTLAFGNNTAISNTGTLTFNQSNNTTLANVITGAGGSLVKLGTNTLTLTGNNTYNGSTTVNGGMLQVGNGGSTGSLGTSAVTVNSGATLGFFHNSVVTIANQLSGTGTLSLLGTGLSQQSDYRPSGNNSGFSGQVIVDKARLYFDNANDLGAAANITVLTGGQVYALGGVTIANAMTLNGDGWLEGVGYLGALRLQSGATASGNITLQSDSRITAAVNSTGTVSGVISGNANLTKAHTGTLTFTGNNTYTGTTTVSAGTLQVGNGDTSGTLGTGAVTIANGANLVFNRSDVAVLANAIDGAGNVTQAGSGTTTLTANNTYTGTTTVSAGTLQIGNGGTTGTLGTGAVTNNASLVFKRSNALTVENVIGGTGDLVQAGTGTTTLAASNTYSGTTSINAGTLAITNASALGDTSGGTTVASGGILDLQNVAVGAESITLVSGKLSASTGTSSVSGPITLLGPGHGVFDVAPGAELTVSGVISGDGGIGKLSAGTLVLTAANTFTGSNVVELDGGTLAITNDAALGSGPAWTTVRGGGTLELRNVAIAEQLQMNGGTIFASTGINSISSDFRSTFQALPVNVAAGAQLTFSGASGSSTLNKNGAGTLLLTGTNTFNSTININAGTLQVGNDGTTGTLGSGAVTVANGANLVFNRSDTVNLSTLASNGSGITGQGNVSALIGGGFNVDRAIMLTGASSSILLEAGKNQPAGTATGGNVTLTSNIGTSATGTVTIFSGHATTAAYEAKISGATGATRYKSYGTDASAMSSALVGTRNYYYREQPGTLTVSGLTATKVYDGLVDASTALDGSGATISGLIDGDSLAYGSLTLVDAQFDSAHAGARTVSASFSGPVPTYSGGGATWSVSGYASGSLSASVAGSITPRSLATSINAVGKTYDGRTSTTSTLGGLSGFVANDSATGVAGITLEFDNAGAGTRNVVASGTGTATGFIGAASGNGSGVGAGNEVAGLASDYVVAAPSAAAAVIEKAPLVITANDDAKIVTQSDAAGYNGVRFDGFVNGEDVGDLAGSLTITRTNAGTEAAGAYAGVLLPTGYSSANYDIAFQAGEYRILPAQQLLVKIQNVTHTYGATSGYVVTSAQYLDDDGVTLYTLTQTAQTGNTYTFSDGLGGSVTFTIAANGAAFSTGGHLSVGNYSLGGTNATIGGSNFVGLHYVGNQAVNPAGLTLTTGGVAKVYDGTTAITGLTLTHAGAFSGDLVSASGTGAFNSKNAGTNVGYTVGNLALNGADAGNYYLASGGTLSGTDGVITPRAIAATGVAADDKVYDGTTSATLAFGSASLSGFVAGDIVALDGAGYTAAFADKNAGIDKTVTVTGLGLSGADAGNYTLIQPTGITADITPKALFVSGVTAEGRIYDGTTAATLALGGASLAGVIAGDTLGLSAGGYAANFADKNVGTGKAVTVTGLGLTGADAGNYTLTQPVGITGDITPRVLSASSVVANDKIYDGTTAATLSLGFGLAGIVAGDDVALNEGSYTATFADRNSGTDKSVTVTGLALTGGDSGNYVFTQPTGLFADITPRTLSLTGVVANDKIYDGTTAATLTITGPGLADIIAGDAVALNGGSYTAQFADKNAGSGKAVMVTGLSLTGADAGNYTLGASGGLTASITPRAITLTADLASKFHGEADPALSVTIADGSLAADDTLESVSGTLARQAGEDVGTYDILLGEGSNTANYAIDFATDNNAFSITWAAQSGPVQAAATLLADQRMKDWPELFLDRDGAELIDPGVYEWRKGWPLLVSEAFARRESREQLIEDVLRRIDRLTSRPAFSTHQIR